MVFTVQNRRELIAAELMAQNACLTGYGIRYKRTGLRKDRVMELMNQAAERTTGLGTYTQSQAKSISTRMIWRPAGHSVLEEKQVELLNTEQQTRILRCIAAEVGKRLRQELDGRRDIQSVIGVYQNWLRQNFTYRQTGTKNDFTAVNLVLRGCGVCQAIASLGTLVLPWLGVETRYVTGTILPTGVGHAWNQLRTGEGRWIHADFTFGLDEDRTPTTLTPLAEASFRSEHGWKTEPSARGRELEVQSIFKELLEGGVRMKMNARSFQAGMIPVKTERPMLKDCRVDLVRLLPLFGGCCEYVRERDQLTLHLFQRSCILEQAGQYLTGGDGYVSAAVLGRLPLGAKVTDKGLQLDLTCWGPGDIFI